LRLDLLDDAIETAIGIRIDDDRRHLRSADLADVGLVEQGAHANLGQVRHLEQDRTAAGAVGGRRDHLA